MNNEDKKNISGIVALLVHAAKIDEQYSEHERTLIKEFIKSYSTNNLNIFGPRFQNPNIRIRLRGRLFT